MPKYAPNPKRNMIHLDLPTPMREAMLEWGTPRGLSLTATARMMIFLGLKAKDLPQLTEAPAVASE